MSKTFVDSPRVVFALLLSNLDEQPAYVAGQVFERFAEARVKPPPR
ncbi:hypothetical protein [Archangium lipolyticum]|nr:hypothetical protein [Archangium lipolyticum]